MKNFELEKTKLHIFQNWADLKILRCYGPVVNTQFTQKCHGEGIVSRYRGEGVARHGAEVYRRHGGAPLPVRGRTAAEPTFWEFVQAVLRDGLLST